MTGRFPDYPRTDLFGAGGDEVPEGKYGPTLCTGVEEARLSRAIDFGPYAASFLKLNAIVESVRRSRLL
jgi:hypothetical protein